MGHELPADLIYDILSRMPVKSLDRFRCVCKQWCKYIDEPNLAIIQMNRVAEEPIPIMLRVYPDPGCDLLTLFRITKSKKDVAKKDSVLEFECKAPFYEYNRHSIRGSCNGLLYLSEYSDTDFPSTTLSVIHPLRNQRYELPPIKIMQSSGLGFDASTNTFKMLASALVKIGKRMYTEHTMVHVLGTDSWREITQIPRYLMKGKGIFAHACLHWLGFHKQMRHTVSFGFFEPLPPNHRKKVVRFDIRKEEFGLIDPPRKTGDDWVETMLVDLHGEVGLVYNSTHSFSMELWVLKQNDQWMIQCQFDSKPPLTYEYIEIVGFWNISGDILVTTEGGKRLFVYKVKNGGFHEVNLVGWEDGWSYVHMYRGSLFSVPGMKKWVSSSSKKRKRKRKERRRTRIPSKLIYRFLDFC
ncbi:unnamed protein product [Lactuca virosa]|uniref:F-box domain-containing protein n=1 Tax=Lactuca virosa TaxID=75947 RepID=A0AAU9NFA1_9ASTR|nr:unnamed protein product [Lactuca virosa]